LYQGILKKGDSIAVSTSSGPVLTKVKGMLINAKGRSKKLVEVEQVVSAAGVRVLLPDKIDVISGSPLIVVEGNASEAFEEIAAESRVNIPLSESGVTIKADALGSLEALAYELQDKGFKIRSAAIGDISKRDIIDVSTLNNPLDRLIIGFNVSIMPEAQEASITSDIGVLTGDIIYSLIDSAQSWTQKKKSILEESRKNAMPVPSKIMILPQYIFRTAKPVIVGVKVFSGRIKVGDNLIRGDGRYAGTIKSIREGDVSKHFADAPSEVAVSIDGVTLNRQISAGEPLYVDIPEGVVKELRDQKLDDAVMETLEEIIKIKRRENKFWGTKT
ncbi:MAG: translation initiation factor IF-2, partial [Thermoplasmataceae archaeon]